MTMLGACPNQDPATISLDDHFSGGETCEQPLITSLALADFQTGSQFGGAKLELTSPRSPCQFSLAWKSGNRTTAADAIDLGAVKIPSRTGAVVLPIALHFHAVAVDLCPAAPFTCDLVEPAPPDSMWTCVP
jgi:hypothetical protein